MLTAIGVSLLLGPFSVNSIHTHIFFYISISIYNENHEFPPISHFQCNTTESILVFSRAIPVTSFSDSERPGSYYP